MRIVVLAKQVPDTWGERELDPATGRVVRRASEATVDEVAERALELALVAKDADSSTEVVVLTMGPAHARDGIRKLLATGADRAVHVVDESLAGADLRLTAQVLAAAVAKLDADLVVAGEASTDGNGGMIPSAISSVLGLPFLGALEDTRVGAGTVAGLRRREGGSQRVHAELPAVVSLTERNPALRFAGLRGVMGAKKKPLEEWTAADLVPERPGVRSVVVETTRRPERVAGHREHETDDSAARLAEYLRGLGVQPAAALAAQGGTR